MKNEIGGYIELDEFQGNEYYPNLIALNLARNALVYLIKARKINKLYVPFFMCSCVANVCRVNDCEIVFYHIGKNMRPILQNALPCDSWLYLVNYYGQLSQDEINDYKKRYPNLILDNVQAFFQKPMNGIDTIYTCRKYFGVPDGAYLATDARLDIELAMDKSYDRMPHLLGRYEGKASEYYKKYQEEEEKHNSNPLCRMSGLTHNILKAIDYDNVIIRRNENWATLSNNLSPSNRLMLTSPEAPFMYPYYCENGVNVRMRLVEKQIYVPVLWPEVMLSECGNEERDMVQNILPLPIDQRYGKEEMNKIISVIKEEVNVNIPVYF